MTQTVVFHLNVTIKNSDYGRRRRRRIRRTRKKENAEEVEVEVEEGERIRRSGGLGQG